MNAIGTQWRDLINSGLTQWRLTIYYEDAAPESGRNPMSETRFSLSVEYEQAHAGRDDRIRLARPNSQARTQTGKKTFSSSADHEQDWQPYPVDPDPATQVRDDYSYINT